MKVSLYCIELDNVWKWHISFDMQVDLMYWGNNLNYVHMFRVTPEVPLHWALSFIEHEGYRGKGNDISTDIISSRLTKDYCDWKRRLRRAMEGIQRDVSGTRSSGDSDKGAMGETKDRSDDIGAILRVVEVRLRGQSEAYNRSLTADRGVTYLEGSGNGSGIDLVHRINGRELLPEEIQLLLNPNSLSGGTTAWRAEVQRSYLKGDLSIRSGMNLTDPYTDRFRNESAAEEESVRPQWRKVLLAVKNYINKPLRSDWLLGSSKRSTLRCNRCGSSGEQLIPSSCASCGEMECCYCQSCLTMGRVKVCSPLISGSAKVDEVDEPRISAHICGDGAWNQTQLTETIPLHRIEWISKKPMPTDAQLIEKWGLSPAQKEAVSAGLHFLNGQASNGSSITKGLVSKTEGPTPGKFLIWAVTGAGKTEMIFPLIESELLHHRSVLVTTPRKDVIIELEPRLKKAFPNQSIVTLYGGSEQRWDSGDITLATTHQLLRFYKAFDFIVIDELDAFPFHNNPMLQYAALKVCRPGGNYIFLSATPPKDVQREVRKGRLDHAKVPVRYHRHPLPVPRLVRTPSLRQWLEKGSLPNRLKRDLQHSIERGAQVFVFIPKIQWISPLLVYFRKAFPNIVVDGTSSKDPDRAEKVKQFRQGGIRVLLTTTILERGVTVPKTDVFILDSDSSLFDEAALVQMAGRAGRSKDDPRGKVIFASAERTESVMGAIRQITMMNRTARRKGYLLEGE